MHLVTRQLATLLVLTLASACGKDDVAAPRTDPSVKSSVSGTTGAVFTQPSDTTRAVVGPAVIHGDVILMTVIQGGGAGGGVDTSQTAPLAGARLTLSQRSTSGGSVTETQIATAVAGSDGTFAFAAVPAGSYVLKAEGPASKPCYPATAYVATTAADIAVHFRLVASP